MILGKDEYGIELIPVVASSGKITANSTVSLSPEKKQITDSFDASIKEVVDYKSVFGSNSTLRYAPTLNGFKEDIILDTYDGTNEFVFLLKTNGLRLVYNDGYSLIDPQTSQTIISMGDLVVYHKGGTELSTGYAHEYVTETVKEDGEYLIKVVVDEEFLLSESTVYPVVIDPSFTMVSANNNIMDIAVRANGIVYNDSINNGVGHHNTLLEDMRTFMKFPGLVDNESIDELAPPGFGYGSPEITSVKLQMYSRATSFTNTLVYVYPYNSSAALNWTYNTTRFTTAQFNAKGSLWSSTSVPHSSPQWVEFDITNIIDSGNENGIVLINQYEGEDNEAVYQSFASTKDPTNPPRIVINWTGENNTDFDNALTMSLDVLYDVNITASGQKKYYAFIPTETGTYVFESFDIVASDPKGWLYDSNETQLAVNDDYGENTNFRITRELQAGQTYYLAAGCYGTITGSYKLSVTLDAPPLPLSPTGLTYSNLTENSVRLSWTIPSNHNADNWIIQRRYNGGTWVDWNAVSATQNGYTLTGLTPSASYEYRVFGESGATAGSGVRSENSSNVISVKMLPSQPTGLSVSSKTDTTVTLTWNTPSYHGTDRWRVEYAVGTQGWQVAGYPTSREYTVSGLTAGTVYAFRVYAESDNGDGTKTDSLVSTTVRAKTLPAQPTGLAVSNLSHNSLTLSWNVPYYHGADRWRVEYKTGTGAWIVAGTSTSKSYNVTGLAANTEYSFRVIAEMYTKDGYDAAESAPSAAKTVTTELTLSQFILNIRNSTLIDPDKTEACVAAATALFDDYEPAFIVGLLANIHCEGNTGILEIFDADETKEDGSKKYDPTVYDYLYNFDKYLRTLDNPTTYKNEYSGKRIWNINFAKLFERMTFFNNLGWYVTADMQQSWGDTPGIYNRIGTGMGCVGWTFGRAYQMLNFYRIKCNYSDTVTESQALEAEVAMILYELNGEKNWVYTNWFSANESNLNSPSAANNAGYRICYDYEQPNGFNTGVSDDRGNLAESLYNDLMQ